MKFVTCLGMSFYNSQIIHGPWSSSIGQGRSLRESILLNRTFEDNFSAEDDSRFKNDLRWFLTWQSMIYTTRSNDFTIGSLRFCGKKINSLFFQALLQSNWVCLLGKLAVQKTIHSKRILLKFQSLEGLNHQDINQGLISHLEYFS